MEYKELLKSMDIYEVKSFKKVLEENPNLLDEYISKLEEKELEKKKEEERCKQAKE